MHEFADRDCGQSFDLKFLVFFLLSLVFYQSLAQ